MVLGGFVIPLLGGVGMFLFGFCLFFNVSLIMVWLYLELANLCLIPLFFSGGSFISFSGLFYYVVFSGVSSGLLLMGLLLPECLYFLLVGFLMKFGVFPLWGWVYRVCSLSSWSVIWGLSTLLKISFVLFPVFLVLSFYLSNGVVLLCGVGCLFLSFLFWVYVFDWKVCWCHMMLSSSSILVGLSFSGCSLGGLLCVYGVYFVWSTLVILYLFLWGDSVDFLSGGLSLFIFSFLLLTLPFSFSIFYKVLVCSCVFSAGMFLLLCWVVYSFSEQFYLFLFMTGLYVGKGEYGFLSLV